MTSDEEKIKIEIGRSLQALDDALYNLNDNRQLTAVNRLYYAVFYIVVAYFISKRIPVKSHKGINIKLHNELVKTGIIKIKDGETFDHLFKLRSDSDYGDFTVYDPDELKELYNEAKDFIQKIESLITINE